MTISSDPPDSRKLLTPADLAEYLGIPERSLGRWRSERTGPLFLRVGTHVRYRSEDVEDWLAGLLDAGRDWMAS